MQNKLIVAVMYSDDGLYKRVKSILTEKFGGITESKRYDFDQFTSYYEKEMGKGLVKRFLIFNYFLNKPDLIRIKKETTAIEGKFSEDNKRKINLDPGYLNDKELVLASFKKGTNYKEELGDNVYMHKVLEFEGVKARVFWHTFPDYRIEDNQEFFIRNK